MLSLLLVPVVAYALFALLLFIGQGRLIFPRHATGQPWSERPPGEAVVASVDVPGGVVESWFFPAPGANAQNPAPGVLFAHGNAELIDFNIDLVEAYHALGVSVLLMEYRGYGRSAGTPSQRALTADGVSLVRWLEARPDVDPDRLIYHGRSIGGGVLCQVALEREPAAMVLESTFTSVASFASRFAMPQWLVRHPFRNDRALGRIGCPVLLVHGRADTLVPIAHARRLRDLARDATLVEVDAGHNTLGPDLSMGPGATFLRDHHILGAPD